VRVFADAAVPLPASHSSPRSVCILCTHLLCCSRPAVTLIQIKRKEAVKEIHIIHVKNYTLGLQIHIRLNTIIVSLLFDALNCLLHNYQYRNHS
jgi:hypothetical protein